MCPFLRNCGFVIKKEVKFIPISGLSGANVKDEISCDQCSWWKQCVENGENNIGRFFTAVWLKNLYQFLKKEG